MPVWELLLPRGRVAVCTEPATDPRQRHNVRVVRLAFDRKPEGSEKLDLACLAQAKSDGVPRELCARVAVADEEPHETREHLRVEAPFVRPRTTSVVWEVRALEVAARILDSVRRR